MMKEPKVSVIMPAYNSEKTINRAVKSVLNQTFEDFELIIVDNGSKDATKDLIKNIKDERIKYIYIDIPNVSEARNRGLEDANGKYITFIDSDDEYRNNFLETLINKMERDKLELVTCGYFETDKRRDFIVSDKSKVQVISRTDNIKEYMEITEDAFIFNYIWNKMYIKNIIIENKIKFDKNLNFGEDVIFNFDYMKNIKNAGYADESLYIYIKNGNGLDLSCFDNRFDIEHRLIEEWEEYYKANGYKLEYVYNKYARIYYNAILYIFSEKNNKSKQEEELDKFLNNKRTIEDLRILKDNVSIKKFRIFINYILLKGKRRVKVFAKINNIRKKIKGDNRI